MNKIYISAPAKTHYGTSRAFHKTENENLVIRSSNEKKSQNGVGVIISKAISKVSMLCERQDHVNKTSNFPHTIKSDTGGSNQDGINKVYELVISQ